MSNFEKTNSDPQKHLMTLTIIVVQIMCECISIYMHALQFIYIYISESFVFMSMSMEPEKGIRSSESEVQDVCEPIFGYWELTAGTIN